MYCREAGAEGDVFITFSYDLHSRYLCPQTTRNESITLPGSGARSTGPTPQTLKSKPFKP